MSKSIRIAVDKNFPQKTLNRMCLCPDFALIQKVQKIDSINISPEYDLLFCYGDYVSEHRNLINERLRSIIYIDDMLKGVASFSTGKYSFEASAFGELFKEILFLLDNRPFITSEDMLYEINKQEKRPVFVPSYNPSMKETVGIVVVGKDADFARELLNYSEKNVIAYFDFRHEKFFDRENKEFFNKLDCVYILNTLNTPASITGFDTRFATYNKKYVGQFDEFVKYGDFYYNEHSSDYKTPTILISSFGPDMGKFELVMELSSQFNQRKIPIRCISSNPCASVLPQFQYVEYPMGKDFRTTVLDIKNIMESIDQKDVELSILDIPGSCTQVDNLRTDYGGLLLAYLSAVNNIDVVILCVNSQIDNNLILKQCSIFKTFGVAKVIIYQSNMLYLKTMIAEGKLSTYQNENSDRILVDGCKVFNIHELKQGNLFDYLYKLFTEGNESENGSY